MVRSILKHLASLSFTSRVPAKVNMRISEVLTYGLLQATAVLASPYDIRNAKVVPSKRPNHPVAPHHPGKAFPASPDRTKTCIVQSHGNGTDDSATILKAIKQCNNGGHVVFPKDQKFTIGTALDLTFLNHIDLGRQHGIVTASTNTNMNQISKEQFNSECHDFLPAWGS
jgi:galacturan 1,4-alpha-galacturonidase